MIKGTKMNKGIKGTDATSEDVKIAYENGISYNTFKNRIKCLGWSIEKARTIKTLTPSQIGMTKKGERNG